MPLHSQYEALMAELECEDLETYRTFVCDAVVAVNADDNNQPRAEPHQRQDVAEPSEAKWQVTHILGALNGKHDAIGCPKHGGSLYFNNKGYHYIV